MAAAAAIQVQQYVLCNCALVHKLRMVILFHSEEMEQLRNAEPLGSENSPGQKDRKWSNGEH